MDEMNFGWDAVGERALQLTNHIVALVSGNHTREMRLYGIPRGGIYAAQLVSTALWRRGFLNKLVQKAKTADVFIDDIIDMGVTRDKYKHEYGNVLFLALVDKTKADSNLKNTWVSFPWERMNNENSPTENIRRIIQFIGEDPEREGLKDTPTRVIKSYEKLFGGYKQNPADIIKVFKDDTCDEMVLVKDIEFFSFCEHHILPFFGKAHIAYIPKGKVIGISKLVRILEMYSRRLQIQERICQQITIALQNNLQPLGVACVLEAQHFCMTARGVEKQHSIMVTSSLTGVFKKDSQTRNEFMNMIRG